MSKLSGHVIFCDDLREEVGGKFTLVGATMGGVELPHYPAVLAKLGISATVVQSAEGASNFNFKIVYRPTIGDELILLDQHVDVSLVPSPDPRNPPPSDGVRKLITQFNLVLSPLSLKSVGRLLVLAISEKGESIIGEQDFVSPPVGFTPPEPYRRTLQSPIALPAPP